MGREDACLLIQRMNEHSGRNIQHVTGHRELTFMEKIWDADIDAGVESNGAE